MPFMPAECDDCDLLFESSAIEISGNFVVDLKNNSVPCPNCGRQARVLDGTFNVRGMALTLIKGPLRTHNALQELKARVQEAQDLAKDDPLRAALRLADAEPSLANHVWSAVQRHKVEVLFFVLNIIVNQLLAPSVPTAEEIAQEVVREVGESQAEAEEEQGPETINDYQRKNL